MIQPEEMLAAGYKEGRTTEFEPNVTPYFKHFYSDDGKRLYTIALKYWHHSRYRNGVDSVSAWSQLNTRSDDPAKPCFDVDVIHPQSIEHVEAFFAALFERMECVPYQADD